MNFVMPPDLDRRLVELGDHVRVAPQSEKLQAFVLMARHAASFDAPQGEVLDRLQIFAEATGLVAKHGDDAVQAALGEAFADPIDQTVDYANEEERAPAFSDEALALHLAEKHEQEFKYVAAWGKWLRSAGTHFLIDDKRQVFDVVRRICRSVAHGCQNEKTARVIASAKTVAATEFLARADRRFAARVADFDSDPWILNTPAGVVDLRSGERRPHRASDLFTKITAISPDANCAIETWLAFLDRVTGSDNELAAFLRRMLGYGLTGSTEAHAMFFLYGRGANGKSTFVNAATGCLDSYYRVAAIETFIASKNERHPTDLAALVGARVVTAQETEEGRRWAESKIKSLTSGDRIAARFMRQDFFEYTPAFKLIIAGNHLPALRSVDEAIRRRFQLIPFTVGIPEAERDPSLGEKLKAEWPGILWWMIEGCLEWQRVGLAPPAAVRQATASYLEAEDSLRAWFEEAGLVEPNAFELTEDLFASWRKYATRAGEYVGSLRKFSQRLEDRADAFGLRKDLDRATRRKGFCGLRLLSLPLGEAGAEE